MSLGRPCLNFPSGVLCRAMLVILFPYDMSHPSPSSSHADGLHVLLVTSGKKLMVGDGLRQVNVQDPSEVLLMEGGQLV